MTSPSSSSSSGPFSSYLFSLLLLDYLLRHFGMLSSFFLLQTESNDDDLRKIGDSSSNSRALRHFEQSRVSPLSLFPIDSHPNGLSDSAVEFCIAFIMLMIYYYLSLSLSCASFIIFETDMVVVILNRFN